MLIPGLEVVAAVRDAVAARDSPAGGAGAAFAAAAAAEEVGHDDHGDYCEADQDYDADDGVLAEGGDGLGLVLWDGEGGGVGLLRVGGHGGGVDG